MMMDESDSRLSSSSWNRENQKQINADGHVLVCLFGLYMEAMGRSYQYSTQIGVLRSVLTKNDFGGNALPSDLISVMPSEFASSFVWVSA
jgi:hypothetical protein